MAFYVYIYGVVFFTTLAVMIVWPRLEETEQRRARRFLAQVGLAGLLLLLGLAFYALLAVNVQTGLLMIGLMGVFSLVDAVSRLAEAGSFLIEAGESRPVDPPQQGYRLRKAYPPQKGYLAQRLVGLIGMIIRGG